MTDQEIVEGFLANNRQAHSIVQEWINAVVRYMARHPRLSIEDIVSDTIEKLLRLFREGQFRGESSLKTYVQRITKYTVIDAARRPAVIRVESLRPEIDPPVDEDPEGEAIRNEQKAIYLRVYEQMPQRCRDLWNRIFEEERPYVEIAAELGISVAAVKLRVFRCKEEAMKIVKKLT